MLDGGDALNGVKRSLEKNVGLVFRHTWRGGKLRAWKAVGASTHAEAIGNVVSPHCTVAVRARRVRTSYAMTRFVGATGSRI